MIRFHSKAGADVLMLQAHADAVLRALGREPAAQGIFEPEAIAAALVAFNTRPPEEPVQAGVEPAEDMPDLARRAWPVLQLLQQSQSAAVPLIWSST